jgi:Tfp pilus assembly protein PilV
MLLGFLASLNRSEDGFTFNEVLLAMNVIVIGILGYSAGTGNLIRWNSASRDYTVAVNLAQDKLEQIKAQKNWTDVNNCPTAGDVDIAASGEPGGQYNRCWTIADSPLGSELKEITVTVSWRGRESREVTLTTLIYSD